MVKYTCRVVLLIIAVAAPQLSAEPIVVKSPHGQLVATFDLADGKPTWRVDYANTACLKTGGLGVHVKSNGLGSLETVDARQKAYDEVVKTVWGKFSRYNDHYRQLTWTLREQNKPGRTLRIVVRVYDRGVGVRYEFPTDGGWGSEVTLDGEATAFNFAGEWNAWCYNGEHDPKGPMPIGEFRGGVGLPFVVRTDKGLHLAVLEAAIFDMAPFGLRLAGPGAKTEMRCGFSESTLPAGGHTSWRVLLVGQSAGDLLTSPVMYCLNPPSVLTSTRWIKPGLAMWDWRGWAPRRLTVSRTAWTRRVGGASSTSRRSAACRTWSWTRAGTVASSARAPIPGRVGPTRSSCRTRIRRARSSWRRGTFRGSSSTRRRRTSASFFTSTTWLPATTRWRARWNCTENGGLRASSTGS